MSDLLDIIPSLTLNKDLIFASKFYEVNGDIGSRIKI